MRFVDCVTLNMAAGHGGAGAVAYRREKFVPRGGPSGGNGGKGGDVVIVADRNVGTLLDLRFRKKIAAEDGKNGAPKRMDGRNGDNAVVRVPVGTLIRDAKSLELLADLAEDKDSHIVASGGRGGLGNAHFKTATHQTPRFAQPGEQGEELDVLLELKLLADVGIIGFPSVGKSTLISVISNARPKIAAYHFTTLQPNLGLVRHRDFRSFVVADIPGLIEGAHEGRGLGYQFLRHVERCRVLLHVIEVTPALEGMDDGRDPIADFDAIMRELELFSPSLAERPVLVGLGKTDLPFVAEREEELRAHFEERGHQFVSFSAVTRDGLSEMLDILSELVETAPEPDMNHFTVPDPNSVEAKNEEDEARDFYDPFAEWIVEDDTDE